MRDRLQVTTAATSLAVLTRQELRDAAGVAGATEDRALAALGLRVAAKIMDACGIAVGEGAEPTLSRETLTQTFYDACADELILARRHEIEVVSVTVDGTAVDAAEIVVDPEAGLLGRRVAGLPYRWTGAEIVVVYQAGFATAPTALKSAASELVQWERSRASRDPYAKSVSTDVPGVLSKRIDYWVGTFPGGEGGPVPAGVAAQLGRFMNR